MANNQPQIPLPYVDALEEVASDPGCPESPPDKLAVLQVLASGPLSDPGTSSAQLLADESPSQSPPAHHCSSSPLPADQNAEGPPALEGEDSLWKPVEAGALETIAEEVIVVTGTAAGAGTRAASASAAKLDRATRTTAAGTSQAEAGQAGQTGQQAAEKHPGPWTPTVKNTLTVNPTEQNRPYNPNYMANGGPPIPQHAAPLLPNQGRVIQTGPIRVLCIADVRGNLRSLNDLAKAARADHIIHTGDFGFYDDTSLDRIAEKTLKHVAQYSPLIAEPIKKATQAPGTGPVKSRFAPHELPLSELPLLLRGEIKLDVPVYTVWGACEDVRVLEKFRSGEYKVQNLHVIDESRSMLLEIGGVKLRLLGLGGAVVMHKLFDNGEGRTTIAGGQGTMWTTLLQMGELVDTANRVYDPTETRIFVTHASPAREGILNQISVTLKADFSISAGLHFRYGSSYNEFSVNPTLDHYRGKLAASKASFNDVWETVKGEVEPAIQQNEAQQNLLKNALQIVEKMPSTAAGGNPFGGQAPGQGLGQIDESAFKNMWNFNLADAAFGWLVLEIQDGRIGTEMRAQGFNFSHRGTKQAPGAAQPAASALATSTGPPPAPQSASPAPSSRQPSAAAAAVAAAVATAAAAAAAQSVATPVPAAAPSKQATPQPTQAATPAPTSETEKPAVPANGETERSSPAPKASVGQDFVGLFIMNAQSDDLVRDLFDEAQDRPKILKIAKWGNNAKVVQFGNEEERDGAFSRIRPELKERHADDRSRPLVKIFEPREPKVRGGAGHWGSSRGGRGAGAGAGGDSSAPGGGYRSDSEGSKRMSSRGPRGGRGERRGGRGRGGYRGEGGGGASPAPAAATPAE